MVIYTIFAIFLSSKPLRIKSIERNKDKENKYMIYGFVIFILQYSI